MYAVFDCTKATGFAFQTKNKWIALLGSRVLTKTTDRVHDYDTGFGTDKTGDVVIGLGAALALCVVVLLSSLLVNVLPF